MVVFDVVVVGGGVVGAAVAREFSSCGKRVLLCEKEAEWLTGASSGNTGHLGSNFYYTPARAPLEAEMTAAARRINPGWLAGQPNVPAKKDGMIYLARNNEEDDIIKDLLSKAEENRINTVRLLTTEELKDLEPDLDTTSVTSSLFSEEEWIIDPWLLAMTHVHGCRVLGVEMKLDCEVTKVSKEDDLWTVSTSQGDFQGKLIVNCGGNFADLVENIGARKAEVEFTVRPGKGEYIILEGEGRTVGRPVVPVPTKQTAGVYVFSSISGHVVVGPTNVRQDSRTDRTVSEKSVRSLREHVNLLYPEVRNRSILGTYAGLRPATQHQDYLINIDLEAGWITLAGIRSTGLTCSLALSQYVCARTVADYSPAEVPELPAPELDADTGRVRFGDCSYRPTHPLTCLSLIGALC